MGLELYSSLPVLAFDVLLVGYLTFSFTRPLLQTKPMVSPMIRRVALKSVSGRSLLSRPTRRHD